MIMLSGDIQGTAEAIARGGSDAAKEDVTVGLKSDDLSKLAG